ncbi:arl6 [Symbiodinium sp. KB8]|nr:arl6 [Symbiodinium sp. KB8]
MIRAAFGLGSKQSATVVVVGLDGSGKTTILNQLKPGSVSYEVAPTVGLSVEEFETDSIKFQAFDMSGESRSRALWDRQYASADAIIFVLDSGDRMRLAVAKDELDHMLEQPAVAERPVPLLVFANKMDLRGAMEPVECMAGLGLQGITTKPWHIQASDARSGTGLEEGMRWLTAHCERFLRAKAAGFPKPGGAGGASGGAAAAAAGASSGKS